MISASTGAYVMKPLTIGVIGAIEAAMYNPAFNPADDLYQSEVFPSMSIPLAVGGILAVSASLNEYRKGLMGSTSGTVLNVASEAVSLATIGAAEAGIFYLNNSNTFESINVGLLLGEAAIAYIGGSYLYENFFVGTLVNSK